MRRALQIAVMCITCAVLLRGEIIDRVVATVNGQPILQSDWDIAMRCEAFLDQRPLQFAPEAARAVLDRLIDQELLRQQVRSFQLQPLAEERLHARMEEIRKQIPGASTADGWQAALRRYGITERELEERVSYETEILRFIDVRLRPTVHVDRRSIEAYYYDKLLPQLREKGVQQAPLAEVSPQIEEILLQQLIDAQLADLLRDLRQESDIQMDVAITPPQPPSAASAAQEAR